MRSLCLLVLVACTSSAPAAPAPCKATFSGNVVDDGSAASCASIAQDGGNTLALSMSTGRIARLDVTIDLAGTSSAELSPATVTSWRAQAARNDSTNCLFGAGSDAVPAGTFALDLRSTGATPHGTFSATLYLHAPPPPIGRGAMPVDCGPGDTEDVAVEF